MKNKILAALIAILAFGQGAMAASAWSLTSTTSSGITTFTITRSESTAAETVYYRTVSLSAIEGQHFTAVSGSLTVSAGQTSKTVTVTEAAPSDAVYKVYSSTPRQYRFELLDLDGTVIAQRDRTVSGGTQFTDTYLNQSITGLAYFDKYGDGSLLSGTTHYLDVAHSGSAGTWVKVGDGGYSQAVHTISTGALYNNNSTLRTYLNNSGAKMYATVYFTQKEDQDGYQYIQILADNSTTYDGNDPDGAVNTPSTSLYKACFILSYDPSGSVEKNPHTQFFPHRWDYADRNAQYSGNSWSWQEFDYDNAHLYEQEFKSATPSLRAENSGSLVLAPSVSNINVRFDAAGSGGDDWYFKDLKVRLALVDATAPTVLNNYKVSSGCHQKGNLIYVSVPFSELVTVEGTPTLTTTWGTLDYCAGSGSNVLTFSGAIANDAAGTFSVSAMSGTVKDLAGNAFSGTVSKDFGITLDATYVWSLSDLNQLATNTYEIATKADLYRLANIVNVSRNECEGITFLQTQDIVCDASYTPIGYQGDSDHSYFRGTYDGQGHTVSGITVTRTGDTSADKYISLFGCIYDGTVQNVVLANSTFTGYCYVGGIAGYNSWGTVRNCRVESSVTIRAGCSTGKMFGGVVGYFPGSEALMTGCVSAATIDINGLECYQCGGIVGYVQSSTLKDCLYIGTSVTGTRYVGSIAGDKNGVTLTNNYYTAISLGGVGGNGDSSTSADQDGARRARTVTLGEGISLSGTETTYNVSGITAYGSTAIGYGGKIYSGEGQTLTLSYTGAIPDGYTLSGYSVNGTPIDGNSFTMPAGDVTVTANVVPVITYIDADGNEQSVVGPTPIVSNEFAQYYGAEGQTNWYYVSGPVSSRQIRFYDATSNIILCDGATLSINAGSLSGIINENGSVNIFSQSRGSGSITVSGTSHSSEKGIYSKSNIDINGGTFTSSVTDYGLYSKEGDVTIRGGIVNISARYDGIYGKENVNIIGGIVNASSTSSNSSYGGISSSGNITIGVSSASDRITASSYKYTTLKVADGQTLTDGTDTYTGTLNADQIAAIAGKTLRMPFDPAEATVNLTAHSGTLAGQTHYWATFYHPNWNYTLPAGAKAYIVKEDKNLYRVGDGTIIPAGVAVVIMAESASLTLTATNANAPAVVGNILQGSNSAVPVTGLSGTPYVLGKVADALGFYQYTGTDIPAGKAYYVVVTP